jgi:hypothetical protein
MLLKVAVGLWLTILKHLSVIEGDSIGSAMLFFLVVGVLFILPVINGKT